MQSRTTHSLVSLALLTAIACAHQQDPEEIFQDTEGPDTGGTKPTAGTGSKAGSVSVGSGGAGSGTSKGGTSALPTGKAGSKSTGGAGGSAAGTNAGGSGGSGGGGGSGTINMPVEGMSVEFKAQSTDENPVDFVGGELHVINDAAQPFTLSDLKIRYYITNEVTDVAPSFIWQWGQFGPMNQLGNVTCTGVVTPMAAPKPGADTYIEFTCSTDGILEAGTKLVMSWKVGAQGMGKMLQADDWSFAATQAANDKIVVLNGNTVVWGIEP